MSKTGMILFGIAIVLLFLFIVVIPAQSNSEYVTETIRVHRGDTLTGYARNFAPDMDSREYIDKVKQMNGMTSGMIYAGEELVVLKEVGR